MNSALLAVGFREGSEAEEKNIADDCFIEDVRYDRNRFVDLNELDADFSENSTLIPFADRIIHFLHATTRDCLRRGDTIGRWGGEEFMILVTDAD